MNGVLTPTFDWMVNGTVVYSGGPAYAGVLSDGDVLKVQMTTQMLVLSLVVADSATFTVNTLPAVTLGSQGYVCELDGPQQLSGGVPTGGVYSGTGITNDSIYPSVAGVGSHWVYYTYTDGTTGCSRTKKRGISVQPAPGQPTVARMHQRGNSRQQLLQARLHTNGWMEIWIQLREPHRPPTYQRQTAIITFVSFQTFNVRISHWPSL